MGLFAQEIEFEMTPAQREACRVDPAGAFYAFPNIAETGWKAKPLASALLEEAGVALIGGPDFGIHGEGYIRFSYANSMARIKTGLDRIEAYLKNRPPGA